MVGSSSKSDSVSRERASKNRHATDVSKELPVETTLQDPVVADRGVGFGDVGHRVIDTVSTRLDSEIGGSLDVTSCLVQANALARARSPPSSVSVIASS
jgi:hypothetical protein